MEPRQLLTTFTVTSLADAGPGTLRDAIERADADPDADTIGFAGGLTGTVTLDSALPDLATPMTIAGPGADALTVAGGPGFTHRIFTVDAGASVAISGLTVTGGLAMQGGGIFNAGTLDLTGVAVVGNGYGVDRSATSDAPPDVAGGGIFNAGDLTVSNSTISRNVALSSVVPFPVTRPMAVGSGGGIENRGTATITGTQVTGNESTGGSGIANTGTLSVVGSTIAENDAPAGMFSGGAGGVYNGGTLTISDSTIARNTGRTGGLDNAGRLDVSRSALVGNVGTTPPAAGALSNRGTATFTNVTFGNNRAEAPGVAAIADSGELALNFATLSGNRGGDAAIRIDGGRLTVANTIFADGGIALADGGVAVSGGRNLFAASNPGFLVAPSDLVGVDPLLSPLGDHGGPSPTFALLPSSPAIDAAFAGPSVPVDQRGVERIYGTGPDIGAYESRGFVLTTVSGDGQHTQVGTAFPLPLTVAVASPFGEPVAGGVVPFEAPTAGPSIATPHVNVPIGSDGTASLPVAANAFAGPYTVIASVPTAKPVQFDLTNDLSALEIARVVRFGNSGRRPGWSCSSTGRSTPGRRATRGTTPCSTRAPTSSRAPATTGECRSRWRWPARRRSPPSWCRRSRCPSSAASTRWRLPPGSPRSARRPCRPSRPSAPPTRCPSRTRPGSCGSPATSRSSAAARAV